MRQPISAAHIDIASQSRITRPWSPCIACHTLHCGQRRKEIIDIGYKNAADVLPKELIDLIRKYVEGEAIYIPKSRGRSEWGGSTGIRNEYEKRNQKIAEDFTAGVRVAELSCRYNLSEDSIRKILKKQKR